MKKVMYFFKKYGIFGILSVCLILLTGCSKEETALVGTGVGAAIGAEAAGKNDKVLGAVVGSGVGYLVGKTVGEAIEEDKAQQRKEKKEVRKLKEENKYLREAVKKWCPGCRGWVEIVGANSCPYCGCGLAVEKYCSGCGRTFPPHSFYQYCHKCVGGKKLKYR